MTKQLSLALVTVALATSRLHSAVPSTVLIKDAHIVTVSGEELSKGSVLLKNGLIQEVGTAVSLWDPLTGGKIQDCRSHA